MTSATKNACRMVSPGELEHYREHGWAKLPGFVSRETVDLLMAIAHERMGKDGDGNAPREASISFFNPEFIGGMSNPAIRPLIEGVGRNAKILMDRKPGIEVRLFTDYLNPKLPASRAAQHGGNGNTDMHQDFGNWGLDRSGGMTFWIALDDLDPESGTMSFLSGSHRAGALGHYASYGEGDLLHAFPELSEQFTMSGPTVYAAGDATVHSNMLVHGAGPNMTDKPRWSYSILVNPSDALWTGAPVDA